MKKVLLSYLALCGLAGASFAADLPRRSAPVAPAFVAVPVFTWTGFYVGAHAGFISSDSDALLLDTNFGGGVPAVVASDFLRERTNVDEDGFIGGAQIGFNWQTGMFVWGLEADISGTDIGGRDFHSFPGDARFAPWDTTLRSDLDWLGTVRGRIGFAFDRWMIYGTGGFAIGGTSFGGSIIQPTGRAPNLFGSASDDTKAGWAAGLGVEYAFTNNWTVKAEWLHYDLGNETVRFESPVRFAIYRFRQEGDIGRVGINFKF
jgi:outer membrane immunogenic protein